jgi:hypothetical protein
MKTTIIRVLVCTFAAILLQPFHAYAQPSPVLIEMPTSDSTAAPRDDWGRADLNGVWNKAIHLNIAAPIEPLPFTAEGLAAFNEVANLIDNTSRCIFPGVPRVNNSPYPFQIMVMKDKVIFHYEYMHNTRVIYTDGRGHRDTWSPSLMGDSIGRWEGDTLVIDTVNLTDRTWLDDHGNRHSDELHVIERWTRVSANQLWYQATIDDPKFYIEEWTTGYMIAKAPDDWEIMEYACTDNNRDQYDGLLQPGALDGSGRDGTAIATPAPVRR